MRRYLRYILPAGIAAAALITLLAGHDAPKPGEPQTARDDLAGVRRAAESSIRSGAKTPDAVRFRGEQVYPQAVAGQVAVCGQADVSGGFVPFVALVGTGGDGFVQPYQVVEILVAATIRDADRTYIETVARCWPGGGSQALLHRTAVPPLPEHPDAVVQIAAPVAAPPAPASQPAIVVQPRVAVAPVPPSASAVPPAAAETGDADEAPAGAIRTVTMRQDANIRTVPHGNAVGVAPRGSSLRVFSEAPGGWLEVGETAPFGWIHGSMVDQR